MDSAPRIPNHEVLRLIGRGAYGEIWLARSLTGQLRAVKVVHRGTFDSDRAFQREFEGMSRIEPISRSHDGLLDILDVGRSPDAAFFYYVMELADPLDEADPSVYRPRTVASERERQGRLPLDACLDIGIAVAEALHALHDHGLTHRDIKPSNIVFAEGRPKIADVGLVAASGQRTFVGTEGYVPPEGPGTAQADLYSLGKVLYELATGQDRLDFPELPAQAVDADATILRLNPLLLRACANNPDLRFQSALEFAHALAQLRTTPAAPARRGPLVLAALALGVVVLGLSYAFRTPDPIPPPPPPPATNLVLVTPVEPPPPPPPTRGALEVQSEPPGAALDIVGPSGTTAHTAPIVLSDLAPGAYRLTARRDGWPDEHQTLDIAAGATGTVSFLFANGSVKLTSAPGGATVRRDGVELGHTPLLVEEVLPSTVTYELRLPGHKPATVSGVVEPGRQLFLATRLEQEAGPFAGQPWTNSLGMRFAAVSNLHVALWETRVQDYAAFCTATGRALETTQEPLQPIVRVNWHDAVEFCTWLSDREHRSGKLRPVQRYRLPTDAEWSRLAGLVDEPGATPEMRDGKDTRTFPWGLAWPPPPGSGNFADETAKKNAPRIIAGYRDGFAQTAPVGSFPASALGLHDLAGNAWEWCDDLYKGAGKPGNWGVLRGGSWANAVRSELLISYRNVVDREDRDVLYGFRTVIETVAD